MDDVFKRVIDTLLELMEVKGSNAEVRLGAAQTLLSVIGSMAGNPVNDADDLTEDDDPYADMTDEELVAFRHDMEQLAAQPTDLEEIERKLAAQQAGLTDREPRESTIGVRHVR